MPQLAAISPTWMSAVWSKAGWSSPPSELVLQEPIEPAMCPREGHLEPKANASARLTLPAANPLKEAIQASHASLHLLDISKTGKDLEVLTYQCKHKKSIMIEGNWTSRSFAPDHCYPISELSVGRAG